MLKRAMLISHGASLDGGAEFALDELVEGLRRHAPWVSLLVMVPSEGVIAKRARLRGVKVAVVAQPRWADFGDLTRKHWIKNFLLGIVALVKTVRVVRSWKPDVIITNTLTIPVGSLAAKLCRIRHLWMVHEFGRRGLNLSFALGYERTIATIGRLSTLVLCCSQAVRDELRQYRIPEGKLVIVYGAVSTPTEPTAGPRGTDAALEALVVGRITAQKGQLLAVQALAAAVRAGANVRLRLVGALDDREYVTRVKALLDKEKLADRVDFTGETDDPFTAYRSAHVLLMCAEDEAFGRVTVEAMKLGLPVIGVNSGGTRELIEENRTGFLVPAGDSDAMGEKLVALWSNEHERASLGRCGREVAVRRFTVSGWVDAILSYAFQS